MDAEEISRLVKELSVSDGIRDKAVTITKQEVKNGKERLAKVVVGKIFSRKTINRETLRANIPKILHSRGSTDVEVVGHNLFVISFSLEGDKRIALDEGPWHFFQDLMVLKQTEAMQTPMEVQFDEITMWVQCHNVPFECKRVGEQVGKVEEVDVGEGGVCVGKFARVRVTRRIDEPLVRGVPIRQEGMEKEVIVLLQYEKLPEFCFLCGRVGHIMRDCTNCLANRENTRFDGRLRAGRIFKGNRRGFKGTDAQSRDSSDRGTETGRDLLGDTEKENEMQKEGGGVALIVREMGSGKDERSLVGIEGDGSSSEGERDVFMEDRMEEEGDRERGERRGTKNCCGKGGREIGEAESAKKCGNSRTPGRMKNNSRDGGNKWKRLAREQYRSEAEKDRPLGNDGKRGGGLKRRETYLEEEGVDIGMKQKYKQIKLRDEVVVSETAVAVTQPRRSL